MPARLRYAGTPGAGSLNLAVEQLSSSTGSPTAGSPGNYLDFATGTFKPSGWTTLTVAVAETPTGLGRWPYTFATTPVANWPDGDYVAEFRDGSGIIQPGGLVKFTMAGGDDQPTRAALAASIWQDAAGGDVGSGAVANSAGAMLKALAGFLTASPPTLAQIVAAVPTLAQIVAAVPTASQTAVAVWDDTTDTGIGSSLGQMLAALYAGSAPGSGGSGGDTAATIAAAVLASVIEPTAAGGAQVTLLQAIRAVAAVLAGNEARQGGTNNPTLQAIGNPSVTRVVYAQDAQGNRQLTLTL